MGVGGGVCVGVCVCMCVCGMLICFVSTLGSHDMGRHKLPIIIIIIKATMVSKVLTGLVGLQQTERTEAIMRRSGTGRNVHCGISPDVILCG